MPQSPERTCQRMDIVTCLLSDQSNAMCIMAELPAMPASLFVCMKTRQVSWRHPSSFAQGLCLDLGKRLGDTFLGTAPSCGLPWSAHARRSARKISHRNDRIPSTRAENISYLIARPRHVIQISNQAPLSWHCSVGLQERRGDLVELGKPYYA